ncbi:hypothetical protein ACVWYN_003113 [Pedobacter sp. UYP24]
MGENLENKDWRAEAPTLAGIAVREVFSVPDGYFNELNTQILSRVYLEELKSETSNQGFEVPELYFTGVAESIKTITYLETLKLKDQVYSVPENYFEESRAAIIAKTTGVVQKSKIVRLWHSKLLKYASAACFVIVAGLGVYFNQGSTVQRVSNTDIATEQMLFDIDEDVIIEHIAAPETNKIANDQAALENYILTNFSSADLTTEY